ncbi:unnamed protein product [Bursaphelenchus xylophilus]|uniref:(pine wood nematode) hypothetical protein n=1 Tax=Bursaphelenchus xylophilus TaxID=6326 RepID=A0A1I7S9W7_BURXY|nr:unnamed protein product [Bursaphelenchus xylophilus]CAG9126242.1 unnamed protein product [Bursaphelenchus xylophilus]
MLCGYAGALVLGAALMVAGQNVDQMIKKCCTAESEECCLKQLNQAGNGDECKAFRNASICLEMELHQQSLLAIKMEKCCWLPSSLSCRRQCVKTLRSIWIPPELRIQKAMECSTKKVRSQAPQNCYQDSLEKLEQCFPSCVMFQRMQEGKEMFDYQPHLHCDLMRNVAAKNPCIFPDNMDF